MIILTCIEKVEIWANIIESAFTVIAIIGAGFWAVYIFKRQREDKPHVEFSADIVFLSKIKNYWIVELVAYLENKGKVQHKMYNLDFDLSSIENYDGISYKTNFGGQLFFPHELKKGSFLKEGTEYFFIEPGVKSKYSHVTTIPVDSNAVIFHTWFKYPDGKHGHTAEATKKVPEEIK
jgi:hypothetical protein